MLSNSPGVQSRSSYLGREDREGPWLKSLFLSTASLGGGSGKVRINVEESVDGKVISSHKREI